MKPFILFVSLFLLARSVLAHTTMEQSFVCPIDGKKFKQVVDASGTRFGARLDSKPLGEVAAPWSLPQCPKCKFVLYQESFDKKSIRKLKPFILSERYRSAAVGHPTYAALASVQEFLAADHLTVGYTCLEASWQVEADPKECNQYLARAYEHMVVGLSKLKPDGDEFVNVALLCGELERRLGKFDEATHRFQELKSNEKLKADALQKIVERQLAFIVKKDTAPHAADESQEEEVNEAAAAH